MERQVLKDHQEDQVFQEEVDHQVLEVNQD